MNTDVPSSPARGASRSRWAAIGAAVAVSLGAGGLTIANATGGDPASFVSITPERILDTRTGIGLSGPFTSPTPRALQVTGPVPTPGGTETVVPAGATGVVLNVTAVLPTADGFISVRPDGTPGPPSTSNLNFTAGDIIPNSVTVALPASGAIEITYDAFAAVGPTTDVLVDVTGYFVATGSGGGGGGSGGGGGDTLAGLSCAAGEVAKWNGSEWACAIDDTDADGYANVITVATSGGDYTSVAAALDSIADSSDSNRYLVRVAPGVYTETNLVEVPAYVHLRGDGPTTTVITSDRSDSLTSTDAATVHLLESSAVSDLTIRNTGTGAQNIAILTSQTTRSTVIDNVVAEATGSGGTEHYAAFLSDAEPVIRDSTLLARGATGVGAVNAAVGVVNNPPELPKPLIERSILLGDPGPNPTKSCVGNTTTGFGFLGSEASPEIDESYICGGHRGIALYLDGLASIDNSELHVSSTGGAFMVETTDSAAVRIASTAVEYAGNKTTGTGNLTCAQSYEWGTYTDVGASCD